MKKVLIITAFAIIGLIYILINRPDNTDTSDTGNNFKESVLSTPVVIEGEEFILINGLATKSLASQSASVATVRVFGEPVFGDLDKDSDEDAALWLQYESGGSGVFYYAALVMNDTSGYKATDTLFLGDRIAPQSLNMVDGKAVYNFAERRSGESFSESPSVGRSVYVQYDVASGEVGEWVKEFEGEVKPLEVYEAQVDRVSVVFENYDYTTYRLITNGQIHEGELNTERGYLDDIDATVYVLDWQKPEGEQKRYVRLTNEPDKIYLLDSALEIVKSGPLIKN